MIEKPLPQPATIEEDFNAHYRRTSAAPRPSRPSEKGTEDVQQNRTRRICAGTDAGASLAAGGAIPNWKTWPLPTSPFGRFDQCSCNVAFRSTPNLRCLPRVEVRPDPHAADEAGPRFRKIRSAPMRPSSP